jgi:hypothetical protein
MSNERLHERWPPPGVGKPDALADIYNVEYERALLELGVTPSAAHQHACEVICRLGGGAGTAAAPRLPSPPSELTKLQLTVSVGLDGPETALADLPTIFMNALYQAFKDRSAEQTGQSKP